MGDQPPGTREDRDGLETGWFAGSDAHHGGLRKRAAGGVRGGGHGSAHTALAPYWSHRRGRDSLTGLQASERTGLVHTVVNGDRVHLTGHAVTILDGTLHQRNGTAG
jgi:Phenazine biosynthesis-like protein